MTKLEVDVVDFVVSKYPEDEISQTLNLYKSIYTIALRYGADISKIPCGEICDAVRDNVLKRLEKEEEAPVIDNEIEF
jgi:hypothetical protein